MTFVRPRGRILERSITSGSGPFALAGAVDGSHNNFASFMAVGDTTYATVVEPGVAFWTGIVTYSAANQITLTTIEESKGSFGAGTKEIFASHLASRAMLAEDIAGAIVTGGSSTAYTVASYRQYDTLARLHGNPIAFTPHAGNGQTVTLNVDGLGAKPLRLSPGVELESNTLVAGTPYTALYNHVDQAFYLHMLGANPYGIPLGGAIEYWDDTLPSSAYVFPLGQALSRTVYARLFAKFGTRFGSGDGVNTFNIFDKSGRVSAMKEASASRLTSGGGFGGNSTVLGAGGGQETKPILQANLPSLNFPVTGTANVTSGSTTVQNVTSLSAQGGGGQVIWNPSTVGQLNSSGSISGNAASGGSGAALATVQPTIICNYILRVL